MLARTVAALVALTTALPALAQEDDRPRRTRVALGPQVVPSYPGSDQLSVRPLFDLSRARGDDVFTFEAADESFGPALYRDDRFAIGPSFSFVGARDAGDVGAAVPKVGFTVEAGGFVQIQLAAPLRFRAEVRKGLGGHKGLVANLGVDYIARDADRWLFALGPRLTVVDDRYTRAYFGITPATAVATGLPTFDAKGGLHAVGATATALRQLSRRWGLYGYARYDRLIDDAARSPLTRRFGSRDQLSGGLALSYTFGGD